MATEESEPAETVEANRMPIRFPYAREKAHNAALWFLHRHGGALDILKLIKLLFYADRLHLARYGRPITGGLYRTLPHGPVAQDLLDDLNARAKASPRAGGYPFRREGDYKIHAAGDVDEDHLSESDIEVLEETDRKYGHHDAFTLRHMTHELKAYQKNDPGESCRDLPYEDFFEDLPEDKRQILEIIREDNEARDCLE